MKKICCIYKENDGLAHSIIDDVLSLLTNNGYVTECFYIDELPIINTNTHCTLLTLGGDGTILSVVAKNAFACMPIIGINTGNVGFFTMLSITSWKENLLPMLEIQKYEDMPLLQVESDSTVGIAINEVSITRSGIARNMGIEVYINEERLYTYSGDGILLATQYGSSAYSLSVGGSIIHPTIPAFIISPIVPSKLGLPPVIIPNNAVVDIHIHAPEATITLDGQNTIPLKSPVRVKKAPYTMPFIGSFSEKYFEHLSSKGILR